jgi:hypothetical protein
MTMVSEMQGECHKNRFLSFRCETCGNEELIKVPVQLVEAYRPRQTDPVDLVEEIHAKKPRKKMF